MGLLDKIFGPKVIAPNDSGYFKTLTAYQPAFTSWGGRLYESELIRASIDAIARHASKMTIDIQGGAKPTLKTIIRTGPNSWMTYSQFLYRLTTILYMQCNCFIVPVLAINAKDDEEIRGYFPILPSRTEVLDVDGSPWFACSFRCCNYYY